MGLIWKREAIKERLEDIQTDLKYGKWLIAICGGKAMRLIDDPAWIQMQVEKKEAYLSMDREKILAHSKKYRGDNGLEQEDEECFWIVVHKIRTMMANMPEIERRKSMQWLTERGYGHYASDLVDNDISLLCRIFDKLSCERTWIDFLLSAESASV